MLGRSRVREATLLPYGDGSFPRPTWKWPPCLPVATIPCFLLPAHCLFLPFFGGGGSLTSFVLSFFVLSFCFLCFVLPLKNCLLGLLFFFSLKCGIFLLLFCLVFFSCVLFCVLSLCFLYFLVCSPFFFLFCFVRFHFSCLLFICALFFC